MYFTLIAKTNIIFQDEGGKLRGKDHNPMPGTVLPIEMAIFHIKNFIYKIFHKLRTVLLNSPLAILANFMFKICNEVTLRLQKILS